MSLWASLQPTPSCVHSMQIMSTHVSSHLRWKDPAKRIVVHLAGVDSAAYVWLNGTLLGYMQDRHAKRGCDWRRAISLLHHFTRPRPVSARFRLRIPAVGSPPSLTPRVRRRLAPTSWQCKSCDGAMDRISRTRRPDGFSPPLRPQQLLSPPQNPSLAPFRPQRSSAGPLALVRPPQRGEDLLYGNDMDRRLRVPNDGAGFGDGAGFRPSHGPCRSGGSGSTQTN